MCIQRILNTDSLLLLVSLRVLQGHAKYFYILILHFIDYNLRSQTQKQVYTWIFCTTFDSFYHLFVCKIKTKLKLRPDGSGTTSSVGISKKALISGIPLSKIPTLYLVVIKYGLALIYCYQYQFYTLVWKRNFKEKTNSAFINTFLQLF